MYVVLALPGGALTTKPIELATLQRLQLADNQMMMQGRLKAADAAKFDQRCAQCFAL